MAEKKKGLSGFKKALLIYVLVFLLLAGTVLAVLYGFCSAYEKSRPYNSMESYLAHISADTLPPALEELLKELDPAIRPAEESREMLADMLRQADFVKAVRLCSEEELAYTLRSGKTPIGTVYLRPGDEASFGFSVWQPSREEYDLSALVKSESIALPPGYRLSINGFELGEEYISDPAVQLQSIKSCYEYYEDLPLLRRYESGKYIGEARLMIISPEGEELAPEEFSELSYLDNCSPELQQTLKSFADEVISRYVRLCANIDRNEVGNYIYMKELIIPESQLHDRMRISFYALGYSSVRSCEILSSEMKLCTDLGDRYFVDLSYTTETWGLADPVTTTQGIQLVLSYDELGELKAEAMFNY